MPGAASSTAIIPVIARCGMRRSSTTCSRSALGAALPKIRAQVNKDMSRPGLPKRKVVAAIARLLDETCIRVGNEEYAKTNKSFGLTTLRDRHANIHGESVHL